MNDYKIITDSSADLTPELVHSLDLTVVPLKFTINGKTYANYPDEREMASEQFYSIIRGGVISSTSQINTTEFIEIFEPILQKGIDILYIAFSSALSGTYNASRIAVEELQEKYPQRKLVTIDSLAASMGQGLLVYHAVLQKRAGHSLEETAAWVKENLSHVCHWFTVDDLNHLKRGGRVSAAAALFGTMLGIKPILHVDDEGHLIAMEKIRGRKASLDSLVSHLEKAAVNPQDQTIFISHGDCLEDAKYVAKQLKEKFKVKSIEMNFIGPVIGSHSGPGTVALFFLGTQK